MSASRLSSRVSPRPGPLLVLLGLLLTLALPAGAQGRIYVVWDPPATEFGKTVEAHFQENKTMESLVYAVDQVLRMPRDLPVIFTESEEVNAWYDPEAHRVVFSYALAAFMLDLFDKNPDSHENAIVMMDGACLFILCHELGHAIIGELDLPTTGKEEDCADEFATIVCSQALGEHGQLAALSAAVWFGIMSSETTRVSQLQFWDEHSLDQQRLFKILCNLYAADPTSYRFVAEDVPAERLKLARERFPRKKRNWERLLAPYEK